MQNTDINVSKIFLNLSLRVMVIKAKSNKWDLIQLKTFLQSKGNQIKNKMTTSGLGDYMQMMLPIRDLFPAYTNSSDSLISKQTNNPIKKWAEDQNRLFLQRRQIDGQQSPEKMFHVSTYERNANQNHKNVSPPTGQNDHHQTVYKQQILERVWRKENPSTLLEGT